jgi:biotin carboxylase
MVVVIDPFSTGAHLAAEVGLRGLKCARLFSIWDSPVAALVQQGLEVEYTATIQHDDKNEDQNQAIDDTILSIKALPYNIIAVIPGAETGVELADAISHRMGLRSNGEEGGPARRNKYLMGEKVRNAGVRAVGQCSCRSIAELHAFVATLPLPMKCVVKPVQSAGSDDVFLCNTIEEAETAFNRIFGKRNGLGLINESALVQEFLAGKEYVIDKCSRDGVHKIVGIWEYDKRSVNGANFVYFGMRSMDSTEPKCQEMIKYADQVLDALGIMQGPSHMEVMYTATGPCLVEVGSRCQGGEGTWLPIAKECIGYTQTEVALDVYLDGNRWFNKIGKDSYPLMKHARETDMVNRHGGIVRAFPGEKLIRALPSFRSLHWETKVGDYAPKTIDCFTRPGCVQFVHESKEQADADFEALHDLEDHKLFDYSVICPEPPTVGAVVVVDAFSSGANLAALVMEWGYRLVLVFSEKDSPVASLVSSGTSLDSATLIVQHDDTAANQERAIEDTLESIKGCGAPVLAIIPGAETGVELADRLATRFGTRSNGESMTVERRDKYLMQEAVAERGLRSIKQKLCRTEDQCRAFAKELMAANGGSLLCVVKPNESAGSDSVYKCDSEEDMLAAFRKIHGQENGLGAVNEGALCQEFLQGTEYVLDGVSRDGKYKVCAIWEYDKRTVNGANFVYFGMKLRDGVGEIPEALMAYAEQVVQAVEIFHGPSHMEIIMTATGPCLVEVGSRCHGGEGTWLPVVKECIGYSQLEATLNAYLRPDTYDTMPKYPSLRKAGCEAFLVTLEDVVKKDGLVLDDIPGLAAITAMASFRRVEMLTQPGNLLVPTIDCFTRPGSVQMVGDSPRALEDDYNSIRLLEYNGLFRFKESNGRSRLTSF